MADRPRSTRRAPQARHHVSVELVAITRSTRELTVLLQRVGERGRRGWTLPSAPLGEAEQPDALAARVLRLRLGTAPSHLEQVGTFTGSRRADERGVWIAYLAITPPVEGFAPDADLAWFPVATLPQLRARQRGIVARALEALRRRVSDSPIVFHLLPELFTLGELQESWELILGHGLHKASFRRSLQSRRLVEPADEWRSDGRGRPAQLFRRAKDHTRSGLQRKGNPERR